MITKYSEEHGKKFIQLARDSIKSSFSKEKLLIPSTLEFKQARGVFVTLWKKQKLRGCIGYPRADYSLGEAIVRASRVAAFNDPRFQKVREDELELIKIEISILTEPYLISKNPIKEIEIGRDGLICEFMGYSGLLLPQVAIEHKMDKIKFLESVCEKAGLPKDSWQNENIKFYKFQAQIFKEE